MVQGLILWINILKWTLLGISIGMAILIAIHFTVYFSRTNKDDN
jgi:uncharacterized membrane protein